MQFEWVAQSHDDFVCNYLSLGAHVEQLTDNQWFCSVYEGDIGLFHSCILDMHPGSGKSGRDFCEFLMRLYLIDKKLIPSCWIEECSY